MARTGEKVFKRGRTEDRERFLTTGNQTQIEYNELRKRWNQKLRQSGLISIEFTGDNAVTSSFFTGPGQLSGLRKVLMTDDGKTASRSQHYWDATGVFLHRFDFKWAFGEDKGALYKTIWRMYVEQYTYIEMSNYLKRRSKQRVKNGLKRHSSSNWWAHQVINEILTPIFRALASEYPEWYGDEDDFNAPTDGYQTWDGPLG